MNNWKELLDCDDIFKFKKQKIGGGKEITTATVNSKPIISHCESIYDKDDQDNCFGCIYLGEYDTGAIEHEDLQGLMDRQRKSIGKVCPRILAKDLAARYLVIQEKVNEKLRHDQMPLPDYSEEDWMNHWLYHNTDPELQGWLRMWEKQRIAQVSLKAMFVKNLDTDEEFIDEKQNKIYNETCKEMETLYKNDVTKKQYYSGGAYLDTKAISQNGTLSYSGKTIIDYMNKKKRQRN
jgi:hypothetical protein